MPPKGYVGIRITPQRKMMLADLIRTYGLANVTEALDFAIAYSQRYVPAQALDEAEEIDAVSLPDFLNYFVGDATPFTEKGQISDLTKRQSTEDNFGKVTAMTWRMDGLLTLTAYEPTILNLGDALDFAVASTIAHSRTGTLGADEVETIKNEVRANGRKYKHEVTEFRKENMEQNERDARYDGTKYVKRAEPRKRKKLPSAAYNRAINVLNTELLELFNRYRAAIQSNNDTESYRLAKLIDDKKAYIAKVTSSKEAFDAEILTRNGDRDEITF